MRRKTLTDLEIEQHCLSDMAHDRVDKLALVVALLAGLDVFLGDPALAEVDVTLLAVHPEDHHRLLPAHLYEAADAPDPAAGEFREQNHPLDVVVLQQGDVGSHVGDVLHLHHHRHVHLRVLGLVHPTLQIRRAPRHRTSDSSSPGSSNWLVAVTRQQQQQQLLSTKEPLSAGLPGCPNKVNSPARWRRRREWHFYIYPLNIFF